jgi:hypothetical protein
MKHALVCYMHTRVRVNASVPGFYCLIDLTRKAWSLVHGQGLCWVC